MIFLDANLLIYLNVGVKDVARFFEELLEKYTLYTDALVLDEVIYVSWHKYGVPFEHTVSFLDDIVLPYTKVLSLGYEEYSEAKTLLNLLKPSDALHVVAMLNNGIRVIASEDRDFERVEGIRRLWIEYDR